MYYRRKVLLALLETFEGELSKIALQKLLLLFSKSQKSPTYDFVPYRFGCFSFQAGLDLRALKTYGKIIETSKGWELKQITAFRKELKIEDVNNLNNLYRCYDGYSNEQLMKETYLHFPYYAIRSEKVAQLLSFAEQEIVNSQIPFSTKKALFTLGYEGISIEKYFNKLIINDIKVLCDVRRNPISQKPGFSKNILRSTCENLGIKYVHIPELGIPSEKRKNLNTQKDYETLFLDYESNHLSKQDLAIKYIYDLIDLNERVALTCFEAHHLQCHRGRITNKMLSLENWEYELIHL